METIGAAHRSENNFNPKYSIKSYSNNIETVRPKLAKKEEKKKCFDEDDERHLEEENIKSSSYFPAFPYWMLNKYNTDEEEDELDDDELPTLVRFGAIIINCCFV